MSDYISKYPNGTSVDIALDAGVSASAEIVSAKGSHSSLRGKIDGEISGLQAQIDQIVVESSQESQVAPEVGQARVDADGTTHSTLKARLDSDAGRNNGIEYSIKKYGAFNIIPIKHNYSYVSGTGITFTSNDGVWTVDGTSSSATFDTMAGSTTSYPDWFNIGETYNITFEPTYDKLFLRVVGFDVEHPDGEVLLETNKSTTFTVPSGYDGMSIRLHLAEGRTVSNDHVEPMIMTAKTNTELTDIMRYTSTSLGAHNIIPLRRNFSTTVSGILFESRNGVWTVNGTSNAPSFVNMAGGTDSFPEDLYEGNTYKVVFEPTYNLLFLRVIGFSTSNPDGVVILETNKSTEFTVPSGYTGMAVRLHLASGRTVSNGTVEPMILTAETNRQLTADVKDIKYTNNLNSKKLGSYNVIPIFNNYTVDVSGITFTATDGVWTMNGTSTAASFVNLVGSTTSLPDGFVAGEKYNVVFEPTFDLTFLRILGFNNEHPSGEVILETKTSTVFTVPSGYTGMIVRIHLANGRTLNNDTVEPMILTSYTNSQLTEKVELLEAKTANLPPVTPPPPMITIIDDDGHVDFLNDLVPIIQSKHVPISTAVTYTRIGSDNTKWMTWDQIQTCYSAGAEVLCHTYSHDPDTPELDVREIEMQYTVARNEMYKRGLHDADILVYNNVTGDSDKCRAAASKVFKCGIHSSGREINQYGSIDKYYVKRIPIELDPYYYDIDLVKELVDTVKVQGGWMVWIIHTSAQSWTTYDGTQCISDAIDYAIEQGVDIVSTNYGYRKYIASEA